MGIEAFLHQLVFHARGTAKNSRSLITLGRFTELLQEVKFFRGFLISLKINHKSAVAIGGITTYLSKPISSLDELASLVLDQV